MKVTLKRYTTPQQYEGNYPHTIEYHKTVKAAIEKVRKVRRRYKEKGTWSGWKIFDKNDDLVHKLK